METNAILALIGEKDFLDKIYQFSYSRCDTSVEAEDLCSDIIVAVLSGAKRQETIENVYAFVWSIARRVYADYSERRQRSRQMMALEEFEPTLEAKCNEIEDLLEEMEAREQLVQIFREIAFLAKIYREVMILYYIDEMKVCDIARKLGISETTVKQRLFSARTMIKREVEAMKNRNLTLKPVDFFGIGTGDPCGNDPREKIERIFSKNLIYLCKNGPKTAKELSEELCVPMLYVEQELEIQCRGLNGSYGMLRKLDNGKYALNVPVVDYEEYEAANKIYEKYLPEMCANLKAALEKYRERILGFPYLSKLDDMSLVLWALISNIGWAVEKNVHNVVKQKYFADIKTPNRAFSCIEIAYTQNEQEKLKQDIYGSDGIKGYSIGGYKSILVTNVYGRRLDAHFHCAHNLDLDEKLLLTIRAIGGLNVDELTKTELEIAAKAMECGYLRKNGEILEPKIVVYEQKDEQKFLQIGRDLAGDMLNEGVVEKISKEIAVFLKKYIPEYMIHEYELYMSLIVISKIMGNLIEALIEAGMLNVPENRIGAEGVQMIVEK